MVKMIVTDLDNTLLRSDKTLSPFTVETLMACKAKGIAIVYATVRPERAARHISPNHLPDYVISNNGAHTSDGCTTLRELTIPGDTANHLLAELRVLPGVLGLTADAGHCLYVSAEELLHLPGWHTALADFAQPFTDTCYKISVGHTDHGLLSRVAESFPQLCLLLSGAESWHHFLPKGATKHEALVDLATKLGIALSDIAAFGDDSADMGMLSACGCGVAVANAIPPLKAVADHQALSCDEDGVAHWLQKYVL